MFEALEFEFAALMALARPATLLAVKTAKSRRSSRGSSRRNARR